MVLRSLLAESLFGKTRTRRRPPRLRLFAMGHNHSVGESHSIVTPWLFQIALTSSRNAARAASGRDGATVRRTSSEMVDSGRPSSAAAGETPATKTQERSVLSALAIRQRMSSSLTPYSRTIASAGYL